VNQKLPEDIRVIQSEEVPLDWHPRKCNGTKTYEYRILNRRISMPTERLYSHFCYYDLDLTKMQQAAEYLIGEHDYKSFCTTRTQAEETVRTIYSLDVSRTGDIVTIRISGSGFLYNMVRIIAGTLLRVGMGFYPPEHVEEILEAKDRTQAGDTAPARGLTLVSLDYEKELPPWHHRENQHWSYDILQAHIAKEKNAYLQVVRCEEEELDGVLRRNIHHQFQNGAEVVYVSIVENAAAPSSTVCATAGSLVPGAVHGRYRLESCGQQEVLSALTQEEKEHFSDAQWLRAVPAGESGTVF
jgi:tRNA pseudouridine38-40 synthase